MEARKKLAKINQDAETPMCQFHSMVARQEKKVRFVHIKWKDEKTKEEEIAYPNEEFYEDLFTQDAMKEEVYSSYKDLYQHRTSDPDYNEIIDAVKTLSEVELQKTEFQITMEELSSYLKRTRNNTAPGLSRFTGSFYKINWSILTYIVHQINMDNCPIKLLILNTTITTHKKYT